MSRVRASPRQQVALLIVFVLFCLPGAVNIAQVHTGHGPLLGSIYTLLFGALSYWLLFQKLDARILAASASLRPWLLLLLILGGLDQWHNRKVQAHDPMTTSIALEEPARALLLHGHEMYSVTAKGAPISPGPGWILLWAPLTVPFWTGTLCAVGLAIFLLLLYRTSPGVVGIFTVLMLGQPLFLSQMANGQDLYVIALAVAALALTLDAAHETWKFVLLGGFGALVATSRLPIVAFVCVLGVGLWKKNRRAGVTYIATTLLLTVALHGEGWYFAHRDGHFYQPLHVLGRAAQAGIPRFAGAAIAGAGALVAMWKIRDTATNWMLWAFFLMGVLFVPEGVGELLHVRRWDWEGANYISFPIPLLLTALVLLRAKHITTPQSIAGQALQRH